MEEEIGFDDLPRDMRKAIFHSCHPCHRIVFSLVSRFHLSEYPFGFPLWQPPQRYLIKGQSFGIPLEANKDALHSREGFAMGLAESGDIERLVRLYFSYFSFKLIWNLTSNLLFREELRRILGMRIRRTSFEPSPRSSSSSLQRTNICPSFYGFFKLFQTSKSRRFFPYVYCLVKTEF
jgi:hypothetical protein